jgi:hypothetical protein
LLLLATLLGSWWWSRDRNPELVQTSP